jgi:hypothetical protein
LSGLIYSPEKRILNYCKRIQAKIAGSDDDDIRLTEAQRYKAVVMVLKCDPAIIMAKIIQLCLDERSKFHVEPYVLHRMTLDLHNAITPSPDIRSRKRGDDENQFELDFEWATHNGQQVAQMAEAAE